MATTYAQAQSPLEVTTPLGKDVLLLTGFVGTEGVSQLFNFQLDLLAEKSKTIAFDKLLGQKITFTVTPKKDAKRTFNGICIRFSQGEQDEEFTSYRMTLAPQFWLLTRRSQSRIFQQMSVPDILKKVLTGLDASFDLQGTFQPRDYCVQYRETDFNFASRLMEEEGIYYYFKHSAGGHQMVVANAPQGFPTLPDPSKLPYIRGEGEPGTDDRITFWEKAQEIRAGKYTLWDHCFELPHKHLEAEKTTPPSLQAGTVTHKLNVGNAQLELFDYPGEYAQRFDGVDKGGGDKSGDLQRIFQDNTRTVEIRMLQEALPALVIQGAGNCRNMASGYKFTLQRHFNGDGDYVLLGVDHACSMSDFRSGQGQFDYHNRFTAVPAAASYRPPRVTAKPFVQGTQTAVVVGPQGQEIFLDKYGRVKVQFHWDREGKNNEQSSCWVRVAHLWAGKRWGASFWPRIGQEVVVAFEEGDPDRPIIIGSVYNADQMPPYLGQGLDDKHKIDPNVSGIKTNTTAGGKGFNELRFTDTKGKEQVFVHAERDMDVRVKHDSRERVIHDRHLIVGYKQDGDGGSDAKEGGDQRELVHQDKHLHIKRNQIEQIEGNMQLAIGMGDADGGGNLDVVIEKDRKEYIGQDAHCEVAGRRFEKVNADQELSLGANRKEKVARDYSLEVVGNRMEKIGGGQSLTVAQDQMEKVTGTHALEAQTIHLKAGQTLILEAGMQLSLKVGGNFIDIGPAGVSIKGAMVMINSGGSAGSGPGASPQSPQAPTDPKEAQQAKPTDPAVADDSKSGLKSAPG